MKRRLPILIFLLVLVLTACTNTATEQPTVEVVGQKVTVEDGYYMDIGVAELQSMLANKDFTFVNVHIPFEGNIAGTDLSIAYDQVDQSLDQLPADKDAQVVLYCRSGRMSTIAAQTLVGLGYSNIWNLAGGMVAWEQAGLKINR